MHKLPIAQRPDGVVSVWLTPNPEQLRGGVVVLDRWLLDAIHAAFDEVDALAPSGLILRSRSERVFVAGADLAEIDALDDAALDAYLRHGSAAFARISSLPCPSVALVHKAALGGGLELALHCDGLVGVLPGAGEKSWRIGLPECSLGICPGWGGTNMICARVDGPMAIEACASGTTWPVEAAPSSLLAAANSVEAAEVACSAYLVAHPRSQRLPHPRAIDSTNSSRVGAALDGATLPDSDSARAVTKAVRAGCQNGWNAALAVERERLIALRHSPLARAKLDAFLKR